MKRTISDDPWRALFVTHSEVVIDPTKPIESWPLSPVGRERMTRFAAALGGAGVTAVWSSAERKAVDGAEIIADRLGVAAKVEPRLHENDRSATGYIAPPEFWEVVAEFFAHPDRSVRGWETARDAQARIVSAVEAVLAAEPAGRVVIVAHGGVARLLTCHLQGWGIGQDEDRPPSVGGGDWLALADRPLRALGRWRPIEEFGDVGSGALRPS